MSQIDADTIEDCLKRLKAAWDGGDARAYAAEFVEDATYATWFGDPLIGRDQIERVHVDVFGKWQAGTKMTIRPVTVQRLGDDVASVLTVGGVSLGGIGAQSPGRYDKIQTITLVRRDGRWRCGAFHNSKLSSEAEHRYNAADPLQG